MPCEHKNFQAQVAVGRLSDKDGGPVTHFNADITVKCTDCGMPFQFFCKDVGILNDRPTVNPDGTELRVPIRPNDGTLVIPRSRPQFSINGGTVEI